MDTSKTKRYIFVVEHCDGEHSEISLLLSSPGKFFVTEEQAVQAGIAAAQQIAENNWGEFDENEWYVYGVEVGAVNMYSLEVSGVSPVNPRKL